MGSSALCGKYTLHPIFIAMAGMLVLDLSTWTSILYPNNNRTYYCDNGGFGQYGVLEQ